MIVQAFVEIILLAIEGVLEHLFPARSGHQMKRKPRRKVRVGDPDAG